MVSIEAADEKEREGDRLEIYGQCSAANQAYVVLPILRGRAFVNRIETVR